jgi:hypothetical protein
MRVSGKGKKNRELIYKALTDPKFRRLLQAKPTEALGVRSLNLEQKKEIKLVLATVKGIESHIATIADELLCANGGPCGIA